MEYTYSKNTIKLPNKELTILDKVVLEFISHVDIEYVIISGYLPILFGRSRNTEDIDIFIMDDGIKHFSEFYDKIISSGKYWAINALDSVDAYELMTMHKSSLRIAEKGTTEPNFEIKFATKETDYYSLKNALIVDLGKKTKIRISTLELEIAYKLYLGSEKDFADAKHLFITFRKDLDLEKLKAFLNELPVQKETIKSILGDL